MSLALSRLAKVLLCTASLALPGSDALGQDGTATGREASLAKVLVAPPVWQVSRRVTLADLGFPAGLVLDGPAAKQEVFFPVPRRLPFQSLRLAVAVESRTPTPTKAGLQLLVDDVPRWAGVLGPDDVAGGATRQTLDVPLDNAGADGFVKATVAYGQSWTDDRCVDQRLPAGYATVGPETALSYAVDPLAVRGVREAWALLGRTVRIAVPSTAMTEDAFATALRLGAALERTGRRVAYVRFTDDLPQPVATLAAEIATATDEGQTAPGPRIVAALLTEGAQGITPLADIFIASDADLATLAAAAAGTIDRLKARYPDAGILDLLAATAFIRPQGDADAGPLQLLRVGRHVGLAVTGTLATLPGADGGLPAWIDLAGDGALTPNAVAPIIGAAAESVDFGTLGLGGGLRETAEKAVWSVALDAVGLPPGRRPAQLDLELAPGQALSGEPQLANVFFNDVLLRSLPVDGDGGIRRVVVPLPDGIMGLRNTIRVELQRLPPQGDCKALPPATPAQLLPTSRVLLTGAGGTPTDFFQLAGVFGAGVTIRAPAAALAEPLELLTLGARVLAGLVPAGAPVRIAFPGTETDGDGVYGPFISLPGARLPPELSMPVDLGRAGLAIRDATGRVVLDVAGLPDLLVAQIGRSGGVPGLVLAGAPLAPEALVLDRGNVAFADAGGPLLAMQTEREQAVRFVTAGDATLRDLLDRFRVAIVAGAWLVLTVIVVAALRRISKRRSG